MEYKTTLAFTTNLDDSRGVVETVFAVMGNVDKGKDRIWPGAFSKTFSESGHKIKVLDHHRTGTIMSVLGKPLELRELSKGELPADLLKSYPDATGGAWAKIQFLMDTPEGKGAFARIKAGAVDDWSFGYDALDHDYSKEDKDGEQLTVRNLRTVRLFELSPVLWGMNPAAETLSVKAVDQVGVFKEDGRWYLYTVDSEGEKAGEPLADYDSYGEAADAVARRNADEKQEPPTTCVCPECGAKKEKERGEPCRGVDCPECGAKMEAELEEEEKADNSSRYLVVEDPEKSSTWHLPVRDENGKVNHRLMGAAWAALTVGYRGNKYQGPDKARAMAKLKKLYASEAMAPPGEKALEIAEVLWAYNQDDVADGFNWIELDKTKAGRVLSQRNIDRIERAIEELNGVLRSAGLRSEEPSGRLTLWKAGSVSPPTSDKELALLLTGLEMELFQTAIDLEV